MASRNALKAHGRIAKPSGAVLGKIRASSAAEALERIEAADIDVVLTDLEMPQMNGLQLAASIKERHPEIRVVLMSGWAGGNDEVAQLVGAEGFFAKPLEWERLTTFLKEIA